MNSLLYLAGLPGFPLAMSASLPVGSLRLTHQKGFGHLGVRKEDTAHSILGIFPAHLGLFALKDFD